MKRVRLSYTAKRIIFALSLYNDGEMIFHNAPSDEQLHHVAELMKYDFVVLDLGVKRAGKLSLALSDKGREYLSNNPYLENPMSWEDKISRVYWIIAFLLYALAFYLAHWG